MAARKHKCHCRNLVVGGWDQRLPFKPGLAESAKLMLTNGTELASNAGDIEENVKMCDAAADDDS